MPDAAEILPFRKALRLIRQKRGRTQQWLGSKLGKDRSTVTRYESGKRICSSEDIPVLAKALQVDAGLFFRLTSSSKELENIVPLNETEQPANDHPGKPHTHETPELTKITPIQEKPHV